VLLCSVRYDLHLHCFDWVTLDDEEEATSNDEKEEMEPILEFLTKLEISVSLESIQKIWFSGRRRIEEIKRKID
jgi:hypothetical protein